MWDYGGILKGLIIVNLKEQWIGGRMTERHNLEIQSKCTTVVYISSGEEGPVFRFRIRDFYYISTSNFKGLSTISIRKLPPLPFPLFVT